MSTSKRWARQEAKARRSLTGAIWADHNKRQAKPAKQVQSDLRNDWADSYHRVLSAHRGDARINGSSDLR